MTNTWEPAAPRTNFERACSILRKLLYSGEGDALYKRIREWSEKKWNEKEAHEYLKSFLYA